MAQEAKQGLGLLYNIPDDGLGLEGEKQDIKNQTKMYFDGIKGKLPDNEFGDGDDTNYLSRKIAQNENGLGVKTADNAEFRNFDGLTYIDRINEQGSQILIVNGDQVGNMERAVSDDLKRVDEYFNHPKP